MGVRSTPLGNYYLGNECLMGAAPGLVRYNDGGQLTTPIALLNNAL